MKTFKINNINITNDVLLNTFNYMERIDDVFGTGSFSFESKTISYNIPPYSVLTIGGDYFLCSSKATYHYGGKSWYHDVSIIESTAILSRFLIGSKSFSLTGTNTYDYEKVNILLNLINEKYNVQITFPKITTYRLFRKKIEYVFSAGTTLFDALNEMSKNYNYKLFVKSIDGGKIEIDYISLSSQIATTINDEDLLSKTKLQNADNYCKYLESEATNVIDTTNTTIIDNIYPTSSTIRLSEDTYMVKTPTPIYSVKEFWVKARAIMEVTLTFPEKFDYNTLVYKTYEEWSELRPVLISIYNNYFKEYLPDWEVFKQSIWYANDKNLKYDKSSSNLEPYIKIDVTDRLKSKEQYDLIDDKDKPDYVYYSLGSNVIDGFNIFYKNDFWNTIIGQTKKPYFLNLSYEDTSKQGVVYEDVTFTICKFTTLSGNIWGQVYRIEYYPISNPYLINKKNTHPENELNYKNYSLSYGKSSSFVDFDKISNAMEYDNTTLGTPEMIIECDVTKKDFLKSYKRVTVEGEDWYVANVQHRATPTQTIATLNLVINYNKIADVISLNSQYNTVKNPLQNIIERPLYYELNTSFEFTQGSSYMMVEFTYKDGTTKNFVFSPVVLKNDNDTYLYFEMQDQYSAGTRPVVVSGTNDTKIEDVSYVDSNNEAVSYRLRILNLPFIDYSIARNLPVPPEEWYLYEETLTGQILIYKDAREKLTFTIKANNCIIK